MKFKVNVDNIIKEYNILELINYLKNNEITLEKLKEIFDSYENKYNYFIFKLFNYNLSGKLSGDRDFNNSIESEEQIISRNMNEKRDRIIWWLLESGHSKFTNYEIVANKFINDVLSKKDKKQREEAYNKFCMKVYSEDNYVGENSFTYLMGERIFVELFKAFIIKGATEEEQYKLLELYFDIKKDNYITDEDIYILNYCKLRTRKEYIWILEKINKLNVCEGFNDKKYFGDFIVKYIIELSNYRMGFCDTQGISDIFIDIGYGIINPKKTIEILNEFIQRIQDRRNNIRERIELLQIENEFRIVIKFINKLLELISQGESNKKCNHNFNRKSNRVCIKGEQTRNYEIDVLQQLYVDKDQCFKEEICKSYDQGKITPYELEILFKSKE